MNDVTTATLLLSRLQPEKFASLCAAFDSQPTAAALVAEIERHMQRWQRIVDCAGVNFAAMLGDQLTVPIPARSEPAANDQNLTSAYDRDQQNRMADAIYSLNCLSDVLCHIDQGRRGLGCLDSENLSGFLRLVTAQFPEA